MPSNWAQLLGNKVSSIDLSHYNFTSENLGRLRGRGYSGGSACIDLNNFEPSAAELFYRPPGTTSMAGVKSSGPAEVGVMRLARYPNVGGAVPSAQVSCATEFVLHMRWAMVSGWRLRRVWCCSETIALMRKRAADHRIGHRSQP